VVAGVLVMAARGEKVEHLRLPGAVRVTGLEVHTMVQEVHKTEPEAHMTELEVHMTGQEAQSMVLSCWGMLGEQSTVPNYLGTPMAPLRGNCLRNLAPPMMDLQTGNYLHNWEQPTMVPPMGNCLGNWKHSWRGMTPQTKESQTKQPR